MQFSEFSSAASLESAGKSEAITDREKHLIGISVTATRGCIKCTGSRIKRALEAGIAYETVIAAINLAAAVNAGVTLAIAIQGAESENISDPCVDVACAVGVN